jgi:CheY-like chemotaxis protein
VAHAAPESWAPDHAAPEPEPLDHAPAGRRAAAEEEVPAADLAEDVVILPEEPHFPLVMDDRVQDEPGGSISGTKVLIVDDDMRNIFALTALLERAQAEVVYAESGEGALELLGQDVGIALVLMDIMMPVMDGYATIRAIRKVEALKSLPIVAVTGKVVAGERDRCLEAGANAYIPKPINSKALFTAILPWVSATITESISDDAANAEAAPAAEGSDS